MRWHPPPEQSPGPPGLPGAGQNLPVLTNAQWQSNLAWGAAPAVEKVDVREIWRKLWRGKKVITLVTLAGSLLGYAFIQQQTPRYTAASAVMLETRPWQVVEAEAVIAGLTLDAEIIEGEVEVLHSRELASAVVDRLKLREHPEFNAELAEEDDGFSLAAVQDYLQSQLTAYAREFWESLDQPEAELNEVEARERRDKDIVDAFLSGVEATQVGQSPVIRIAFTSINPQTAAEVANALAETYIAAQLESKSAATRQANSWLQSRIFEVRAEVEATERAMEEYRGRSGLIMGKDVTVATQQMTELATQLIGARVARQQAESRLRQVEALIESPGGAAAMLDVLNSELIQNLRVQEAQIRRELAQLSIEYGPKHPIILNRQANVRDIQNSISAEIDKIVTGLRNEYETARQSEVSIQASLDELSGHVAALNTEDVKLRDLQREVDAKVCCLRTFLSGHRKPRSAKAFSNRTPGSFPSRKCLTNPASPTSAC